MRWLAELRPFGGLALPEVLQTLPEHVRGVETLLLVLPTWRANRGVADALAGTGELVERVGAVVIDAATFGPVAASSAMGSAEADALASAIAARGIEVFRLTSAEDLATCLRRPLVVAR